jgi:hypothetical protein
MSDELNDAVPDVWLVELTNEQMATFWSVVDSWESILFDNADDYDDDNDIENILLRRQLRPLRKSVSNARPIWEQSPTNKEQ